MLILVFLLNVDESKDMSNFKINMNILYKVYTFQMFMLERLQILNFPSERVMSLYLTLKGICNLNASSVFYTFPCKVYLSENLFSDVHMILLGQIQHSMPM